MIPKSKNRTKPYKGFGRSKPMNRVGKSTRGQQHRDWHRELMAEWVGKGISSCEFHYHGCMRTFGLALAHSRKRRFITSKEQYWEVGLACVKCHEVLDNWMSHEEMEAEVKRIIQRRG